MNDTAPTGQYCPACDGTGTIGHVRSGEHGASHIIAKCSICDGEGYIPFPKCRRCADTGYVHDAEADRFDRCACRPPLWVSPGAAEAIAEHVEPPQWRQIAVGFVSLLVLLGAVVIALAKP